MSATIKLSSYKIFEIPELCCCIFALELVFELALIFVKGTTEGNILIFILKHSKIFLVQKYSQQTNTFDVKRYSL